MSNENLMSGYTVNISTVIKMNLENYKYVDGFPILKELIQNACDAGATELKIGHYKGNPNTPNPLLHKSGIIVYNNGAFCDEDGDNIATIGGENKRNDRSTIGKYGLGLKSIYHLCEAFFFYGHEAGKLRGVCPYFNGFATDKKHESWVKYTDDDQRFLQETIESFTGKVTNGLTLIIPIDTEEKDSIVGGRRNIDVDHPFNKGDLHDEFLISNVITSLVILSKTAKKNVLQKFTYVLKDKTIALQLNGDQCQVEILQNKTTSKREVSYTSLEIKGFDDVQFVEARAKKVVERLKKGIDKADKILDEEKVVLQLIRIPKVGEIAKLKIVFAVYLPLPDQKDIRSSYDIGGNDDYILVIHAPFAVDSGRRHIEDFRNLCSEDVTEDIFKNKSLNLDMLQVMYRWWNKAIFQYLVAPNIANLLDKAVKEGVLLLSDCQMIVKEIRNSFGENAAKRLNYLFARTGFVCCYNERGKKEWTLYNLEQKAKIINVPETLDDPLISKISSFVSYPNCLVIVHDKKFGSDYFLPVDYDRTFVDSSYFQQFIESLPNNLLCKENGFSFLVKLLKANNRFFSEEEKKSLGIVINKKLKLMLSECGSEIIQQNELDVEELTDMLKNIIDFDMYRLNVAATSEVWKELWSENCPFVILPTFGKSYNSNLLTEESQQYLWIEFLSKSRIIPQMKCILLREMVGGIESVLNLIKNRFRDSLNVFELVNVGSGASNFFNYSDLEKNVIFKWFDNADNFVIKLAKLLSCGIYKMRSIEGVKSYNCDKNGVLECLQEHFFEWASYNQFDDSEKESFLKSVFEYSFRNALVSAASSDLFAFLLSGFDLDAVKNRSVSIFKKDCCEILKKIYFRSAKILGQQKKVVDVDEDRYVFIENHKDILQNVFVDENDCVQMLAKTGDISFLKEEEFTKNREIIISKVWNYSNQNPELYLRLPLHLDCNGKYCAFSAAEGMYFNKQNIDIPIDGGYRDKLIACEQDGTLAAFQNAVFTRHNGKILTYSKAVSILFDSLKDSAQYSLHRRWILDSLKQSNQGFPEDERAVLLNVRWIALKNGGHCSLNDVLLPNFCTPATLSVLRNNIAIFGLEDTIFSPDEADIAKKIIDRNHSENYKNEILQIVSGKLKKQIDNIGYLIFEETERNLWNRSLDVLCNVESLPIFGIFYKLSHDPILKEIDFFDLYKDLFKENRISRDAGIKALEQIVSITFDSSLKSLYCKIFLQIKNQLNSVKDLSLYPTRGGVWASPENISCYGEEESIPSQYKLPEELKYLEFSRNEKETSIASSNKSLMIDDAIDIINNSWRRRCKSPSYVDVILFLLRGLYRKSVSCQPNVENAMRELFNIAEPLDAKTNVSYWCKDLSVQQRFDAPEECAFKVNMFTSIQDGTLTTTSLTGEILSVERNLKEVYYRSRSFSYNFETKTFDIVIFKMPESRQDDFVDDSIDRFLQSLLTNVYKIRLTDEVLSPFVNQIRRVDQISIGAARARIFDGLFYILKGVKNDTFKQLDAQMNKLYEKSEGHGLASSEASNKLNNELISKIENDVTLQGDIFRYVRNKVKQNQYSVSSILFELFQNADDSVNDLVANERIIGENERKIIVRNDLKKNCLEITHFGRKINEIFGNQNDDKYKWDLLNMLSLSYSDKDSKLGDTGKFGLGFKSIYMLCDRPVVRSGELQFEIVAGLYPKNLNQDPAYRNSTYFELGYKSVDDAKTCVDRFSKCSAYLSLFSKHIKSIEIEGTHVCPELKEISFSVPESKFFTTEVDSQRFLLLDYKKDEVSFKMMFKLDNGRIVALTEDDDIPRVWSLSPLEAAKRLPFIINSSFELDTGRLNLAGNGVNKKPIDKIAIHFSEVLIALYAEKSIFVDDILNLMLKTFAMQDGEMFKSFAEKVLHTAYRRLGRIPSGYGTALSVKSNSSVYTLAPTTYTDYDDEFMLEVQKFADKYASGLKIATSTVLSVFKNEIPGCRESNIFEIIDRIPNMILSFEVLKDFMSVSECFANRYSFWKDFLNRKLSLSGFYMMNMEGNYKVAGDLVLEMDSISNQSIILHSDYRSDSRVRNFLAECPIFEKNRSRFLQHHIENIVPPPPPPPVILGGSYDENGEFVDSSIVELSFDELRKLYEHRNDIVDKYYGKLYDSSFYDTAQQRIRNYEVLKSPEWNETWCILLLTAVCQSLPFYNHQESSIRVAVSYLKDKGVINAFLSNNTNVLQETYDTFVRSTEYEEACLRPFEMLLRLHKIKNQFETFHMLLRSLPYDQSFNSIEEILTTSTNYKLDGSSIHLYSIDRTFKKGMHFLLRELLRNGFWDDLENEESCSLSNIKKQAYMPKHRVLAMLGLNSHASSSDIFVEITKKFANIVQDPTLDNTYDILFLAKDL